MSHDPLVVTTKDGVSWLRRAVTQDGRGLYAVTDSCKCPEYLLATLAELAEHGIAGSADVLPVPVGPEPLRLTAEREREIGTLDLLAMMPEESAAVVSGHLAALLAEVGRLRARVAELEAQRERRRVRLVALQNDALSMRGSLSPTGEDRKVPFPLGEALTPAVDWLIARVSELEAVLAAERARHVEYEDSPHCRLDGEFWPCPLVAAVDAVQPSGAPQGEPTAAEVDRCHEATEFDHVCRVCRPSVEVSADKLTRLIAPTQVLREEAEPAHPVPCRFPKSPGCTCGMTGADVEPETGGDGRG
jgi:hypothetical protein